MNPDTLERLVIDRAMGELSPDVAALLEAHMKLHPQVADEVRQIEETLVLAERSFQGASQPVLPPPSFDSDVLKFPKAPTPAALWLRMAPGLAACLIAGVLLGSGLVQHRDIRRSSQSATTSHLLVSTPLDESAFWSIHRLRPQHLADAGLGRPKVSWKSPTQRPEIEITP